MKRNYPIVLSTAFLLALAGCGDSSANDLSENASGEGTTSEVGSSGQGEASNQTQTSGQDTTSASTEGSIGQRLAASLNSFYSSEYRQAKIDSLEAAVDFTMIGNSETLGGTYATSFVAMEIDSLKGDYRETEDANGNLLSSAVISDADIVLTVPTGLGFNVTSNFVPVGFGLYVEDGYTYADFSSDGTAAMINLLATMFELGGTGQTSDFSYKLYAETPQAIGSHLAAMDEEKEAEMAEWFDSMILGNEASSVVESDGLTTVSFFADEEYFASLLSDFGIDGSDVLDYFTLDEASFTISFDEQFIRSLSYTLDVKDIDPDLGLKLLNDETAVTFFIEDDLLIKADVSYATGEEVAPITLSDEEKAGYSELDLKNYFPYLYPSEEA